MMLLTADTEGRDKASLFDIEGELGRGSVVDGEM